MSIDSCHVVDMYPWQPLLSTRHASANAEVERHEYLLDGAAVSAENYTFRHQHSHVEALLSWYQQSICHLVLPSVITTWSFGRKWKGIRHISIFLEQFQAFSWRTCGRSSPMHKIIGGLDRNLVIWLPWLVHQVKRNILGKNNECAERFKETNTSQQNCQYITIN